MLEKLFVYGTLKDKDTQKEVLGRKITETRLDVLEGYCI